MDVFTLLKSAVLKQFYFQFEQQGIVTSFPQNLDIDNRNDLNLARLIIKNKNKFNLNL